MDSQPIKQFFLDNGADDCGVAAIDRFGDAPAGFSPADVWPRCRSVIAFGMALPRGISEVSPRLVYSHFNGDVLCSMVDRLAFLAARQIEAHFGGTAVPLPCDAPNEYWEAENLTARGIISMKHTAVLSGLGQLGKSTLLLNPTFGNQLTVGAVLTDLDLASDPLCENICLEKCTHCIDACPVHAIGDGHVNQKLCRPNTYGKTARGFGTVECTRCRNECPMRFGKPSVKKL